MQVAGALLFLRLLVIEKQMFWLYNHLPILRKGRAVEFGRPKSVYIWQQETMN